MAVKLLKKGQSEKAIGIYQALSERGDFDSSEKLMNIYLKEKNKKQFEYYRNVALELLEKDETIGIWTKTEKITRIKEIGIKQ